MTSQEALEELRELSKTKSRRQIALGIGTYPWNVSRWIDGMYEPSPMFLKEIIKYLKKIQK